MSRFAARPAVVLAVLLGAGAVVLAGGRPWAGQPVSGVPGLVRVTAAGSQAAPAATALALVAAAGAVALALSGRIARRIVAGLLVPAGLGVVGLVVAVLRDPAQAVAPALQAATGRTVQAATGLGAPAEATGWPWLGVAGGLLIAASGLVGIVVSGRWGTSGRRFEAPAGGAGAVPPGSAEPAAAGGWSAAGAGTMDGGPPRPRRLAGAAEEGEIRAERSRAGRERVLDDWDALSRGEDPTAG